MIVYGEMWKFLYLGVLLDQTEVWKIETTGLKYCSREMVLFRFQSYDNWMYQSLVVMCLLHAAILYLI